MKKILIFFLIPFNLIAEKKDTVYNSSTGAMLDGAYDIAQKMILTDIPNWSYTFNFDLNIPTSYFIENNSKANAFFEILLKNDTLRDFARPCFILKKFNHKQINLIALSEAIRSECNLDSSPTLLHEYMILTLYRTYFFKQKSNKESIDLSNLVLKRILQKDGMSFKEDDKDLYNSLILILQSMRAELGIESVKTVLEMELTPLSQLGWTLTPFYDDKTDNIFEIRSNLLLNHGDSLSSTDKQRFALNLILNATDVVNTKPLNKLFSNEHEYFKQLQSRFDSIYPPTHFNDTIQKFIRKNSSDEKWKIVDFWGTWCTPCRHELPMWQIISAESNNFDFIAFSVYSPDVDSFLLANNYTFPNLELSAAIIKELKLSGFPSTFLISPEGNAVILPFIERKDLIIEQLTGLKTRKGKEKKYKKTRKHF